MELLAVEISSRTNVPKADVLVVLSYEEDYTIEADSDDIYLDEIAAEIGNTYKTDKPEYKGIEHISEETALAVLYCKAEIFWEIGINVELDDEEK